MDIQPTHLRPISSRRFRLTFGPDHSLKSKIDPLRIMQPTIDHFRQFAIGPYFWFIVDLKKWKTVCGGGEVEKMTPLRMQELFNDDHQKIHDITHPMDLHKVNAFSSFYVNLFLSLPVERKPYVKMALYFRILNSNNEYYWIMVQYPDSIHDWDGAFVYGLVFATDISHFKKDGQPMMSILDTFDGNCQQFYCTEQKTLTSTLHTCEITKSERNVLHYLALGFSSKEIASKLNLSIKTIDNHRQNMLHKTSSRSSAELISFCVTNGYL
ncbi:MAG: response regulator transcription factor [Proteobacteria bacterium]|nr:response regulator transcription factor [Pseudomonadota bacterium]